MLRKDFLSPENSAISYLCFRLTLLHSVSYFFLLYQSPSSSLCTVFDSISSNIDVVLSINPSNNVFVFEDFNVHHKDWLTYSGGTDRPGDRLSYNFSISNNLTQTVNLATWILDFNSHSLALLDLFLSSDASICSTMAFPSFGKSDHVVISVSIDFPSNSQQDAPFHFIDYSPWEDTFKLSASAAASDHHKYQLKLHSSPWFSAACATAIVHINYYQQNKSSESNRIF